MSEDKTEIKPLTFHEAAELLEELAGAEGTFKRSTQRRVYEYIQKFLFMSKEDVDNLISRLESLGIPRKIAIEIAYLLPTTHEELRPFFMQMRQMGMKLDSEPELSEKIIEITKPIWEEKYSTILSLRNLSVSALKKAAEKG